MVKYTLISLFCTPARVAGTLINVPFACESSPTSRTAAGEATSQFSAGAPIEAWVGGTLCHVLCAGGTLPTRCTGAGEVFTTVSTVSIYALCTGTPVNLGASSGWAASVAREADATSHTGGINDALGGSWTCHCGAGVCCLLTVGPTETRLALAGDAITGEDTDTPCLAGVGGRAQTRVFVP